MVSSSRAMTDSIRLSLRGWPKPDPDQDALPFLISRINEQRGSFRNVTEDSLQEEIHAVDNGHVETIEEIDEPEEVQDSASRRAQLVTAREEMLGQVTQARNASGQALEFISLLISQHTPGQAEKTLSSYVKTAVPLSVLGTDSVRAATQSDAQKHTDSLVAVGWKMQALDSVADSLLESATSLEQEMDRETRYWNEVLAVKEHGWSVSRMPKERHILGVKFGFDRAYADFRDRGHAALRRDEDGEIALDRGSSSSNRILRVRIMRKEKTLSCSTSSLRATVEDRESDDIPIERQILQARDNIFDKELNSELHREARNLINQGVRCVGDTIHLPYEAGQHIEIELVELEEGSMNGSYDDMASAVSIALRVLLTHAHRQNLHRRSQPPPPIKDSKHSRPVYPILKPILETIRHRSDAHALDESLTQLTTSLHLAGLSFKVDQLAAALNLPSNMSASREGEPPATETLLNALTSPLHTHIRVELPSGQVHLTIELHTSLLPPALGSEFRTRITSGSDVFFLDVLPETMKFTSCVEFEEYMLHLLTLDLVSLITTSDKQWDIVNPHIGALSRTVRDSNGSFSSTNLRIYLKSRSLGLEWQIREGLNVRQGAGVWNDGVGNGKSFINVVGDVTNLVAN